MSEITYQVDPDGSFRRAITLASQAVGDLTVPFNLIAKNWYQSNKAIFSLSGPGKYKDLSEKYKATKKRKWGFVYPILKASGTLESSITDPSDGNAINLVINGNILELGTRVGYGVYHQSLAPRTVMPFRPFLFIGAEDQAPASLNTRRDAWVAILSSYVDQVLKQKGVAT
jgi:phage gpG-like protein